MRLFGGVTSPSGDPHWADVLLLLNGSGLVTHDSSSFNRALGSTGVVLSATQQLFGADTYFVDASQHYVSGTAADTWWGGGVGAGEWCDERWVYPTSTTGTGQLAGYSHTSIFDDRNNIAGRTAAACDNIGFSSYSVGGGVGLSVNNWHHIAWVRDNTTDPTWGYCRLYVDGTLVGSTTNFAKTDIYGASAGFACFIGYLGPATCMVGYQTQVRLTKNTARYYANFAVPTAAFPTF